MIFDRTKNSLDNCPEYVFRSKLVERIGRSSVEKLAKPNSTVRHY